jgi:uncharacterized protein (TIGR02444 family)
MGQLEKPDVRTHHSPFWRFSLKLYGMAGVPPACLVLQDESGVDVNVLLFGLFLAGQGRRLAGDEMSMIAEATEAWRANVVVPVRTARRFLKEPPQAFSTAATEALRERVKAIELEAERLQQEGLYALRPIAAWGEAAAPAEAAKGNAAAYEARLGATFDRAAIETLLSAFARMPASTA